MVAERSEYSSPPPRGGRARRAGGVSKVGTNKTKEIFVEGTKHQKCLLQGILLLLLLLIFSISAEAAPRISSVDATVTATTTIPAPVAHRMESSIHAISEQLLLGKSATMSPDDAGKNAAIIREVFDKVLVGYTVTSVVIGPAEVATVHVELTPWADRIEHVTVTTQVDGMPPEVESLVRQDLAGVEQAFDEALLGLPIAAADWTNGVLKREVQAYLEAHLPEFRADFDVTADEDAAVTLTVYPRLPVVRTVDLSMRSNTMPNMLLLSHRELMKERADLLVGVPVAFTERHRAAFEQMLADAVDGQPDFRALRMKTTVTLSTGERAAVMARSDSDRYRVRATGWVDVGRSEGATHDNEDDLVGQLHAGVRFDAVDELYTRLEVTPQDVDWRFQLGWQRDLGWGTAAGLRYDFKDDRPIYDFGWRIAPAWSARYEYRPADSRGEGALRYRLHDFLSLEYAVDSEDSWLRVIGNF